MNSLGNYTATSLPPVTSHLANPLWETWLARGRKRCHHLICKCLETANCWSTRRLFAIVLSTSTPVNPLIDYILRTPHLKQSFSLFSMCCKHTCTQCIFMHTSVQPALVCKANTCPKGSWVSAGVCHSLLLPRNPPEEKCHWTKTCRIGSDTDTCPHYCTYH